MGLKCEDLLLCVVVGWDATGTVQDSTRGGKVVVYCTVLYKRRMIAGVPIQYGAMGE